MTDDPDIRIANSVMDYLFRRLAIRYLSKEERAELNILTTAERLQPTLAGVDESVVETRQGSDIPADPPSIEAGTAMRRSACNAVCRCNAPGVVTPARAAGTPPDAAEVDGRQVGPGASPKGGPIQLEGVRPAEPRRTDAAVRGMGTLVGPSEDGQ
jgi:ribonucleoside-diphosphate reductase alpha chain